MRKKGKSYHPPAPRPALPDPDSLQDNLTDPRDCKLGFVQGTRPFTEDGVPKVVFTFGIKLSDDRVRAICNLAHKVQGCTGAQRRANRRMQIDMLFDPHLSYTQQLRAALRLRDDILRTLTAEDSETALKRAEKEATASSTGATALAPVPLDPFRA